MAIKTKGDRLIDDSVIKRNGVLSKDNNPIRWWLKQDKNEIHKDAFQVATRIYNNLSAKRRQNYIYSMMYNDVDTNLYATQVGSQMSERSSADSSIHNKITLNVVQNAIDMATSLIAKERPRPLFLADGAKDYAMTLKSERLSKYVCGVIDDCKIYSIAERVFTDGGIYGSGAIKLYIDQEEKKIKADWCFIGEILVDDVEGLKEKPAQMHQRKYVSRDELCEMYPDFVDEIMSCNNGMKSEASQNTMADVIPVYESWHLKSGPNAKDGLHAIFIETATLFHEPYEYNFYPIILWRWYHQSSGFWGRGICQEISKIQRTINKIMRTIDQAQELMAVPLIQVPKTAMISDDHLLSNEIGRMIEYYGEKGAEFLTPPAVQQELYQWIWALEQRAYNIIGINQNMAQGQKPDLGSNPSGAAIREATDIASGRFEVVAKRWQDWFTEIAMTVVELSRELYQDNPDLSIRVRDKDSIRNIKWADVDMDRDRFDIGVYQVSALPSDPVGRLQTIEEFGERGWMQKENLMGLIDDPDLKRFIKLETATGDLVEATVSHIKEHNEYTDSMKPIKQMNLDQAIQIVTKEMVLAKLQGATDEILDLLQLYINDLLFLKNEQMPPPPPINPGMNPQASPGIPANAPIPLPPGPPMPQPPPPGIQQ